MTGPVVSQTAKINTEARVQARRLAPPAMAMITQSPVAPELNFEQALDGARHAEIKPLPMAENRASARHRDAKPAITAHALSLRSRDEAAIDANDDEHPHGGGDSAGSATGQISEASGRSKVDPIEDDSDLTVEATKGAVDIDTGDPKEIDFVIADESAGATIIADMQSLITAGAESAVPREQAAATELNGATQGPAGMFSVDARAMLEMSVTSLTGDAPADRLAGEQSVETAEQLIKTMLPEEDGEAVEKKNGTDESIVKMAGARNVSVATDNIMNSGRFEINLPPDAADGRPIATPASVSNAAVPRNASANQGGGDDANMARINRGMQSALAQRGGTVTLRLHPPELGFVRVQLELRDGQVRANFAAEQESARTMLTHELGQLRQALERQGLTVERLDVGALPATTPTAHGNSADARQDSGESAGDGRSRGQYAGGDAGNRGNDDRHDDAPRRDFEETLDTLA